ncbi:MAG TPA: hypothetical protein VJR48_01035 [Ktedonobacterales bacterium]|nr:hypothetical protein [Ktedonobacterales bacterium]
MERELIEALEAHRAALKREVAGPGFASRPTRNQTLTELLALDRLINAVRVPVEMAQEAK